MEPVAGGGHALYERVIAIVPVNGAGSGSAADPKRPMFTPSPAEAKATGRSGIISWHYEVSDDGKWAIVELVATNRAALQPVLTTNAPGVSVLQRDKSSRDDIERAVKRFKKDFDLDKFAARVQ